MKKNILILVVIMGLLISCTSKYTMIEEGEKNTVAETAEKRNAQIQKKPKIAKLENRDDIYYGKASYEIKNQLEEARTKAKKKARMNLSEKIETKITTYFKDVVFDETIIENGERISKTNEQFKSKVTTYSEQVLTDLTVVDFLDYPEQGYITVYVYISKEKYKEKVENYIEKKKKYVKRFVIDGDKEYEAKNYRNALDFWIKAKSSLIKFLGDIPIQIKLENRNIEVNSYLEARVKKLLLNTKINFFNDKIYYDANGKLTNDPQLVLMHIDSSNNEIPMTNFPIKTKFIKGDGELIPNVNTGNYGEIEIQLNYVNPKFNETILESTIDTAKIEGLELFSIPTLPKATKKLQKTKTIAILATFENGNIEIPTSINNEIKAIFIGEGFNVIELNTKVSTFSSQLARIAIQKNADYLFTAFSKVTDSFQVGGYENMYKATCGGNVALYKLPNEKLVNVSELESVEGFGISAEGSGWDAFGNIKSKLLEETKKIAKVQ